jgi:hypothetical protein
MAGFDPVDDGFGGYVALLAGFKNGKDVFHGNLLSVFIEFSGIIYLFLKSVVYIKYILF